MKESIWDFVEREQQEIKDIANISSSLLSCIMLVVNSLLLDARLKGSSAKQITLLQTLYSGQEWDGGKVIWPSSINWIIGEKTFRNWIQKEDNKRQTRHILGQYVNIVWFLRPRQIDVSSYQHQALIKLVSMPVKKCKFVIGGNRVRQLW